MNRFPPKKILVAFDFSAPSAAAWRQAVLLASRLGASLEVVHVLVPLPPELAALRTPGLSADDERKTEARIRETVGQEARISLAAGDPVAAILRLARSRRADLIVMGTHGRTGLKRVLLGSVAEAVARRSHVPVLAVRGEASEIRKVLAPVNFTSHSYYGFTYAASAASALNARLTALHVHLDPIWGGNPERKLAALLDRLPPALRDACRPLVEHGQTEATKGILKSGAKHDLIVLVAHEKSPIKDMILGTTADRVLRRAPCSVLVVPAPRRPLPAPKDLPAACCATT